ncbi:28333_t:CDS:1, partial [Gigaspora margarita]
MEATMSADNNYNIRKNTTRLKSLMIIKEEWMVLEELIMILALFAKITELLGSSNYSTLSFMWPAITTLTRNCEPLSMNISNEELDLINMLTIFEEEEEENIVDLDDDLEIITMADGSKFKFSQSQNMDCLVEKVKESLYKALSHYWNAPFNCSLIAMLLDPH